MGTGGLTPAGSSSHIPPGWDGSANDRSVANSRPSLLKAMPLVRELPSPRFEPTTVRSVPSVFMRTTARSSMALT